MSACNISAVAKRALHDATQAIVDRLSLVNGVLHCQFLSDGEQVRILEYTRRMSGDLYSRVVQLVCGFRHSDLFVHTALGTRTPALWDTPGKTLPWVARHCITSDQNGYFDGVTISDAIRPFILSLTHHVKVGSRVTDDGRSKVATIILSFPTELIMKNTALAMKELCQVTVREYLK